MKFRYDINALRAIAVIAVMLFHFKVPGFQGGFVGVDIFFVISGYLMSKIIFNGITKGDFSIIEFYLKRGKRIIPSLLCVSLTVAVVTFFCYLPDEYCLMGKNAASSLLFYSNIQYWISSTSYFNQSANTNIFLHTWSLSVEWQYYMIYPIVIVGLKKYMNSEKIVFNVFSITTTILFLFSVCLTYKSPSASFFLLPSRAWEMLMGGIAFLCEKNKLVLKRHYTVIAYCFLVFSIFYYQESFKWPGFYTFPVVFATFIIILANNSIESFVQNKWIQYVGKISYSLYLWHWPVLVFSSYIGFSTNSPVTIVFLLFVTSIFGSFGYYFIESGEYKNLRLLATSLVFTIGCFFLLTFKKVNSIVFDKETIEISSYHELNKISIDKQMSNHICFLESSNEKEDWPHHYHLNECLKLDTSRKNILLIGDSHAAALSSTLFKSLERNNIHLLECNQSGTLPTLEMSKANPLLSYLYNEYLVNNNQKIDGVILAGWWANCKSFDYEKLSEDLLKTINFLKNKNIPCIVLGQNEVYIIPYPSIAAKEYQYKISNEKNFVQEQSRIANDKLKAKIAPYYIDIYGICSTHLSKEHVPYMFDSDHFSEFGAMMVVDFIEKSSVFNSFIKR